jgi:hypothetical protein
VTVAHRAGLVLSCLLMVGTAPLAEAAGLPWKDANPLERLFGPSKPAKNQTRNRPRPARATPAVAAPALAAVPIPDARPDVADDATTAPVVSPETEPTDVVAAPADKEPAGTGGSEKQSAPAGDREAVKDIESAKGDEAAKNSEVNKGNVPAEAADIPAEALPVPAAAPTPAAADAASDPKEAEAGSAEAEDAPADPAETATMPIDDIPVPAVRPEAPDAGVKEPAAAPQTPAPSEPAKADEAPNSTENLKSRTATVTPAASVLAAAAIGDAELCEAELTKRGVEFAVGESISEGECGVLRPINVKRLSSGVEVSPDTQFLCRTALALDDWMTAGVLPAVKTELPGRTLSEFRHASTYVCRPRASESGISEHSRGSAIDIAAFVFDKGEDIGVETKADGSPEAKFQAAVRAAACGPFKTVLGPGTDSDHATHFHLDIAARNNGSTYCK